MRNTDGVTPGRPTADDTAAVVSAVERGPVVGDTVRNQVFAAPADDPRARRPADVATLLASLVVVLLLAWTHRGRSDFDSRILEFLADGVPGWIDGIATIVFILGAIYALGLVIGIALFARDRWALVRDMLTGLVLTFVAVIAASYLAGRYL